MRFEYILFPRFATPIVSLPLSKQSLLKALFDDVMEEPPQPSDLSLTTKVELLNLQEECEQLRSDNVSHDCYNKI